MAHAIQIPHTHSFQPPPSEPKQSQRRRKASHIREPNSDITPQSRNHTDAPHRGKVINGRARQSSVIQKPSRIPDHILPILLSTVLNCGPNPEDSRLAVLPLVNIAAVRTVVVEEAVQAHAPDHHVGRPQHPHAPCHGARWIPGEGLAH